MNTEGFGDIFVGRRAECESFTRTLSELTSQRASESWWSRRSPASKQQPRVFLIQGASGLGKSTLVRRFSRLAGKNGVNWVSCNWDNVRDAGTLPVDLPALLVHLYNALQELLGDEAVSAFEDFREIHKKHADTKSKVAKWATEARSKYDSAVAVGARATGAIVSEMMPPGTRTIANELAKSGIELAGSAFASFVGELSVRFSDEERDLYSKPSEAHASEFVKALVKLGKKSPVILAQDTCELAERENLQGEFRNYVVKPCLDKSAEIVFVLAGRTESSKAYATLFDATPSLVQDSVLQRFGLDDVADYLDAAKLPRTLAMEVHAEIFGLPYCLQDAVIGRSDKKGASALALRGAADAPLNMIARILSDVTESLADSPEEIRRKTSDRHRIYSLALVYNQDPQVIADCWTAIQSGSPVRDQDAHVGRAALKRSCASIFEEGSGKLLPVFREGARRYIWQRIEARDGWLDEPAVRKLNQAAVQSFETRLAEREKALAILAERRKDGDWMHLAAAVLSQRFWFDPAAAMKDLCQHLIESSLFNAAWVADLVSIAAESPASRTPLFESIRAGVADWAADPGTDLPLLAMWDRIGEMLPQWNFPPEVRSRLALHRARVLFRLKRLDESTAEAGAGLAILPKDADSSIREDLVSVIVEHAASSLRRREYVEAVNAGRRAIALDPGNLAVHDLLIMALGARKEFGAAHKVVDDYATAFPGSRWSSRARCTLFSMEGRDADAQAELRKIASDPGALAEYSTRLLEGRRSPVIGQIVLQVGRDAGGGSATIKRLETLSANPEGAAEVAKAYMRLLSIANPTADELIRPKQLAAEKFPDWAEALIEFGAALLAAERLPEALAQFERAQALAPTFHSYALPAELLMHHRKRAEALPICEQAVKRFPDLAFARAMLIKCLAGLERADQALEVGIKALDDFPNDPLLKSLVGPLMFDSGQTERGWQLARDGYAAAPERRQQDMAFNLNAMANADPPELRKFLTARAGMPSEARDVFLELPSERSIWCYIQMYKANMEGTASDKPSIGPLIEVYDLLVSTKPEDLWLRRAVADLCEDAGQLARAAAALEAGLVQNSASAEAGNVHRDLARLYRATGQQGDELRHLRAAKGVLPPAGLRYLAALMLEAGELKNAIETYDESLDQEVDPDFDNQLRFAQANLCARRFDPALEMAAGLKERRPDHPDVLSLMATALFYNAAFEESAELAQEALALAREKPVLLALAARSLAATGKEAAAVKLRDRAKRVLAGVSAYDQACTLAILGERDDAIARLDAALADDPSLARHARWDADFFDLQPLPGFKAALRAAQAAPPPALDAPRVAS